MKTSRDRLLLVDDDDDLRRLMSKRFEQTGLMVDEAHDVTTAKRLLYEHTYDIIVLDLMMQPESGYSLFEFMKVDPKLKWVPLIVVSGSNDLEDKVKCLELGADDYVTKPFQYKELIARVHRIITRSRQFEQLAFRDGLTGVYNRRYLSNQLDIELQRANRLPVSLSLVLLDIDRFKHINDTYGHQTGDQVLQTLAQILLNNLRQTDLLARYGGEEFVILMLGSTAREAKKVIDNIREIVNGHTFSGSGQHRISVSFSAGISDWKPGMTESDWLEHADSLLYGAKQSGRNQVHI